MGDSATKKALQFLLARFRTESLIVHTDNSSAFFHWDTNKVPKVPKVVGANIALMTMMMPIKEGHIFGYHSRGIPNNCHLSCCHSSASSPKFTEMATDTDLLLCFFGGICADLLASDRCCTFWMMGSPDDKRQSLVNVCYPGARFCHRELPLHANLQFAMLVSNAQTTNFHIMQPFSRLKPGKR